ncbi:TonB-dependent siderophore receptor [Methylomonas koyamae]|uniref:TonB-dependent siderophore receptor n=1 Tax=Methylomonas koyamae TaxID=702114 RepID=UPI0009EA6CED|nr:TonB-dependent receptor [Methylomonas koyamae]
MPQIPGHNPAGPLTAAPPGDRTTAWHHLLLPALLALPAYDAVAGSVLDVDFACHIAAQALDRALVEFSLQSGLQIVADGQLTAGLNSSGASGRLKPSQALAKILAGSGLGFTINADNSVLLHHAATAATGDASLPDFTVVGRRTVPPGNPANQDYRLQNSVTATKTDTALMETPFSVAGVTRQVLLDRQAVRLDQALQLVAGVLPEASSALLRDSYTMRGFSTGNGILAYRDGSPFPQAYSNGFSSKRDPANLERLEVLKGPGSILFGRAEPGGIVNMVTKQPSAKPYYAVQQQFGSFDYYRTSLDATGPAASSGNVLYRFNAAYENAGSFTDFVASDRLFVAPVLKWQPNSRSQFTAEFEYQRFDESPGAAIPPLGNRPAAVARSRNTDEPDFLANRGYRMLAGFNWSHEFNDFWQLSQRFYYHSIRAEIENSFFTGPADAAGNIQRGLGRQQPRSDNFFTSLQLTGRVAAAGLKHTLLLGGDYYRADDSDPFDVRFLPGSFNVFAPVYSPIGFDGIDSARRTFFAVDTSTSWFGLYLQDQIEMPYRVFVLGGLRFDQANQLDRLLNSIAGDEHRVSPRGGLLWRALPELSLYANYSENFGAQNGRNGAGEMLPAQTAQQWELGAKTELANGKFFASAAYFDLSKQHAAVSDPVNPQLSTAIGAAQSRGAELEISGEPLPGWRIVGGYSYLMFAEIVRDTGGSNGSGDQGHRLPNAPRHSGSLFTSFEFQSGPFAHLKLGAGCNAVGQRQGNQANDYQVPGYVSANVMAAYSLKLGHSKLTAQLNVENAFDKYYFVGSNTGYDIFFGAPRTFLGAFRVEY